ncbi:MAG: hypothetical protein OEU09_14075 [Rhodospirillales bacterium]|nr:hypothetical protein [Rhodospirillales bacterium]MDH3912416.1 hypothetical protein [Rhodospirillales bacterium]
MTPRDRHLGGGRLRDGRLGARLGCLAAAALLWLLLGLGALALVEATS